MHVPLRGRESRRPGSVDQLTDLWQAERHHGVALAETANQASASAG